MKTNIKILLIFFLLTNMSVSGQITFEKTYGGVSGDHGYSVSQTSDNGYIISGATYSYGDGGSDVYLIKTNSNGDTLWTKTFGGINFDQATSVIQTYDGGYIIAGETTSYGAGFKDVYLIKTNANGNSLWTKTFGGIKDDIGNSMVQTSDSGFVITGSTIKMGQVYSDVYLIKTDKNGDTLWTKTFGGIYTDVGNSITLTSDKGYFITGTKHITSGNDDIYLIRTDENGDTLWTKTYGGFNGEYGYSGTQTSDGGFICTGQTYSMGTGFSAIYIIKTDGNGSLIWSKNYGGTSGSDWGKAVVPENDGGVIITGCKSSNGRDVYLIKINANGDSLWTRDFGGTQEDIGYSVSKTNDGGYVIAGETTSFGAGYYDVYLIKTDSSGIINGILSTIIINNSFITVYPNPFNDFATIEFENSKNNNHTLMLYNKQGQLARKIINITTGKIKIERQNLKSGLYFFQLLTDTQVIATGKLSME